MTRVVIIGGGAGGVATAFWLTSTPELRERFQVALYTQGWRLGGKCASGRDAAESGRIEEHGLHLWLGCYRRAFQMMALCCEAQPEPFPAVNAAFEPILNLTLMERDGPAGAWSRWPFPFAARPADWSAARPVGRLVARLAQVVEGLLQNTRLGPVEIEKAKEGLQWLRDATRPGLQDIAVRAAQRLGSVNADLAAQIETRDFAVIDPSVRRFWVLANLALAIAAGVGADILACPAGFDAGFQNIEARDFRDWLSDHWAGGAALNSAPLRSLYDLAFAYPEGDTSRPGAIAAGSMLGLVLRMIDYSGAPFFRAASTMADTVFAPLYRLLRARGVHIEFFHRLKAVTPSADGRRIETVLLGRQVRLKSEPYDPFPDGQKPDRWPGQPDWRQIVNGDALQGQDPPPDFEWSGEPTIEDVTLAAPRAFDELVLAVPPEVLKPTTRALTSPRWRQMLDSSASVATQSLQLWLQEPVDKLGWPPGTLVGAFEQPFAAWADMSYLIQQEAWPADGRPGSLHYFCGPMTTPTAGEVPGQQTGANATEWMDSALPKLWKAAAAAPATYHETGGYCRPNFDLSELYVQLPPGSVAARLRPDSRVYANLYLAGDWTRVTHSGGCVENAVESALLAARAISGDPTLGGD